MYSDFEKQNISRVFLCIVSLFVLSCFADDAEDAGLKPIKNKENLVNNIVIQQLENEEKEPEVSPRKYCSFLSRVTFYWYTKFVQIAAKREIQLSDIWEVEDKLKVDEASKEFNKKYFKELENIEISNRKSNKKRKFNTWSSLKVISKVYGREWLGLSFVKIFFDILNFVAPKLLNEMIEFVKHKDEPIWHGGLIVFFLILSSFLKNVLISYYFESTVGLGIRFKSSLTNLIFSKTLKMSPKARKNRTTGEIVNLMQIDASRFADVAPFLAFVWSSPFQIALGIYLLYEQLGKNG